MRGQWHDVKLSWKAEFLLYLKCLKFYNMGISMYYLCKHYTFLHQAHHQEKNSQEGD